MNNTMSKFGTYTLGQKLLFVSILMILMALAFYLLHYEEHQAQMAAKQQELTKLQTKQESLELLKANREEVLSRLEALKRQLLIAREQLPVNAEVPSLLQRIHNQAKTAGLEIDTFKRVPDQVQPYYTEIPVEMELVGTYDELANFFYFVGRMTRIVNVRELKLSRRAKDLSEEGDLKVNALATTFMYNKANEAAGDKKKGGRK